MFAEVTEDKLVRGGGLFAPTSPILNWVNESIIIYKKTKKVKKR